jgi:neutral trehalase
MGFDARQIRANGDPVVCGTLTNTLHNLSRMALRRPSVTAAIIDRLYDPSRGLFRDDAWPPRRKPMVCTWAALSPLALPDLPEEIARRLIGEHLLNPETFWLPVPPPSVSATEHSFSVHDRFLGLRRYWRGPTWVNSAWMLWLGLLRLGYEDAAQVLGQRILAAVAREGLREYYNPRTGAGMGARDFAWSALAAEFVFADPRARNSYL